MVSAANNTQNESVVVPRLVIRRPDGVEFIHDLTSGSGAIAGSDQTCSLHLDGEGVAGLHCMIRHEHQAVFVKDWYSESGTFVNDQRIDTETQLPEGGTIRIGGFSITVRFEALPDDGDTDEGGNNWNIAAPVDDAEPAQPAPALESEFEQPAESAQDLAAEITENVAERQSTADLSFEPEPEPSPQAADADWFGEAGAGEFDSGTESSGFGFSDPGFADDCDPETFALLKAEVEHLQNELAQRDARIAELAATADNEESPSAPPAVTDTSETASLVDRLEQLLDELNQSDARMATMEELLRLAEDANVAEREERRQIDSWVGDIECRIGEREDEWNAEREVLRQRIADITAERDEVERRMGNAGASKEQQAEFQRILEQLRGQAEGFREKLEAAQVEKADLEARLEDLNGEKLEHTIQQRLDEAMREERLAFAQEQATMARERAELSRLKMELERARQERGEGQNEIDGKFRAFREHLKDLHEQESQEREERSLSSRLSKLWKRLEGRSS